MIGNTIRVPEKYLWKAFKIRLSSNDCYNRGFVLDGYPRNYKDCQKIFTSKFLLILLTYKNESRKKTMKMNNQTVKLKMKQLPKMKIH